MRATRQRGASPALVVRLHEATGSARTGWDAALRAALRAARAEVDQPIAAEISRQWVDLGSRGVTTYHVNLKVAFRQSLQAPKAARRSRRAS